MKRKRPRKRKAEQRYCKPLTNDAASVPHESLCPQFRAISFLTQDKTSLIPTFALAPDLASVLLRLWFPIASYYLFFPPFRLALKPHVGLQMTKSHFTALRRMCRGFQRTSGPSLTRQSMNLQLHPSSEGKKEEEPSGVATWPTSARRIHLVLVPQKPAAAATAQKPPLVPSSGRSGKRKSWNPTYPIWASSSTRSPSSPSRYLSAAN